MGKEAKTNAMRMLDKKKIPYEAVTYECDEFIDGLHSAAMTGALWTLPSRPGDAGKKPAVLCVCHAHRPGSGSEKGSQSSGREVGGDDTCERYYEDHRLCPGRLLSPGNEEAVSHSDSRERRQV